MDAWSDIFAPIIGRILVGGFFLWNGIAESLNFPSTALLMQTRGLPQPVAIAAVLIAAEVLGGIALVVGFKTRQTALLLALFTIAAAFVLLKLFKPALPAAFFRKYGGRRRPAVYFGKRKTIPQIGWLFFR